jgi:hypothetical protein
MPKFRPTFRRVVVVIALLFAVPSALAYREISDTRPLCERSTEWASAHSATLPQTLEGLAAYPVAYRPAILTTLTPEVKAAMWKEHLARWANSSRPDQRDVIRRAMEFATAEVFRDPKANQATARSIVDDGQRVFGAQVAKQVFTQLGETAVTPHRDLQSLRLYAAESVRSWFTAAADFGDCTCSVTDDWCNSTYYCRAGTSCTVFSWGCGSFGLFSCDGICWLTIGGK